MLACVQHAETQPLGASKENRSLPSRYLGSPRFRLDAQMAEMHDQLRKVKNEDVKVGMHAHPCGPLGILGPSA